MAKKVKAAGKHVMASSDETIGRKVDVTAQGAGTIDLDVLTPLQGNLKDLSENAYQKYRASILELGISFPVVMWEHRNKKHIINGHQLVRTLKRMRDEEGFTVPKIPYATVEASNRTEAAKKVLAAASQYGSISQGGMFGFMEEFQIGINDLKSRFEFPEIDFKSFESTFYPEEKEVSFTAKQKPVDGVGFEAKEFEHKCPKCGFLWDK